MIILITPYDNKNFYNSLIENDYVNIYLCDTETTYTNKKLIKIELTNIKKLKYLDLILSTDSHIINFAKNNKIPYVDTNGFDIDEIKIDYSRILENLVGKPEKIYNIAYVSPLPPDKSGIADYSEDLLYEICNYFNIDVYAETKNIKIDNNLKKFKIVELETLYDTCDFYDLIIYNIGNNYEYHGNIFKMAIRIPGFIILHDYKINDMMNQLCNISEIKFYNKNIYYESLLNPDYKPLLNGTRSITNEDTITFSLLNKCYGGITHTIWAFDQMRKKYNDDIKNNIFYIPMGNHGGNIIYNDDNDEIFSDIPDLNDYNNKNYLNNCQNNIITKDTIKFGVFGYMTINKRINKIILAFKKIIDENNIKIHLFLVGKQNPDWSCIPGYQDINSMVRELHLEKYITIIDYVDISKFNKLVKYIDVSIGLRYPTNGESSGTITKFLYFNKPCIISDVDQFKDYPNSCTFKLPVNIPESDEINILASYIIELTNDDLRNKMSKCAKLYSEETHTPKIMVKNFINIIKKIIKHKHDFHIDTKNLPEDIDLYTIDIFGFYREDVIKKLNTCSMSEESQEIFKKIKNMNEYTEHKSFLKIADKINELYKTFLNRSASISDIKFVYNELIKNRITLESLKQSILSSKEHKSYIMKLISNNERINEINNIYLRMLNRNGDYLGLQYYLKRSNSEIKNDIMKSNEYKICKSIYQIYWKILHRVPDIPGFEYYKTSLLENKMTLNQMEKYLYNSNEYKNRVSDIYNFILQKKSELNDTSPFVKTDNLLQGTKIKYISSFGTSGYAIAALDYIYVLYIHGATISFDYAYIERLNKAENGKKFNQQILLYNKKIEYDFVILHCMPENWFELSKLERYNNSNIKIYGFLAWETDSLPSFWTKHINSVDHIIVPSNHNKNVVSRVTDKPVSVIEHLIEFIDHQKIVIPNTIYKFLIVSQWNSRKGVEETIRCYLSTFSSCDKTLLYVKTFVDYNNNDDNQKLKKYIEEIIQEYPNAANIIINVDYMNEKEMLDLYANSDCFLSLCHAEGVGLGVCQSAYLGKSILITGYGGQIDYIKNGYFVDYKLGNVKPCVPSEKYSWTILYVLKLSVNIIIIWMGKK